MEWRRHSTPYTQGCFILCRRAATTLAITASALLTSSPEAEPVSFDGHQLLLRWSRLETGLSWSSCEQTLLNLLTRLRKLPWGQVSQGAVRPVFVVVPLPSFELRAGVVKRQELLHVQTLVPQPAVEGLDVPVIRGFTGSAEIELNAPFVGPRFERAGREFGAVVARDRDGGPARAMASSSSVATHAPRKPNAGSSNTLSRFQ